MDRGWRVAEIFVCECAKVSEDTERITARARTEREASLVHALDEDARGCFEAGESGGRVNNNAIDAAFRVHAENQALNPAYDEAHGARRRTSGG